MQIVNSGNFSLKAPSVQRNLLFIQPEELQYPRPDSLDDFLQAMNPLNKIYYLPLHSYCSCILMPYKRGERRRLVMSVPLDPKAGALLSSFFFCVFLVTSETEVKSGHSHLYCFQFCFQGSRSLRMSGGSYSQVML